MWRVKETDLDVAGYAKCLIGAAPFRRFCYVIVRNAGHMTPAFQPRASWDMINRFLASDDFVGDGPKPNPQEDGKDAPQCGGYEPFANCDSIQTQSWLPIPGSEEVGGRIGDIHY